MTKNKGLIKAVCISAAKGTPKENVGQALFIENYGIQSDAHAEADSNRQVSILPEEKITEFKQCYIDVKDGEFGENLIVSGIDSESMQPGTVLVCGSVKLEITQIGKECHTGCSIAKAVGKCIMPSCGIFARVLSGGTIKAGDCLEVVSNIL